MPVIGMTIPLEQAQWRVWEGRAYLLSRSYVDHLDAAGCAVVLLPVPASGSADAVPELVAGLDGIVIPGGGDIDPSLYGAAPHPKAGPFDTQRDLWESALIRAALDKGVPILGICRGLQLANVVLGGTLVQHLPDLVASEVHNPELRAFGAHDVEIFEGSWIGEALGRAIEVSSYHHQAVDELAEGLRVTALAEDGTIEGAEDLSRGLIGVQWHPEARDDNALFRAFAALCAGAANPIGVASQAGAVNSKP